MKVVTFAEAFPSLEERWEKEGGKLSLDMPLWIPPEGLAVEFQAPKNASFSFSEVRGTGVKGICRMTISEVAGDLSDDALVTKRPRSKGVGGQTNGRSRLTALEEGDTYFFNMKYDPSRWQAIKKAQKTNVYVSKR